MIFCSNTQIMNHVRTTLANKMFHKSTKFNIRHFLCTWYANTSIQRNIHEDLMHINGKATFQIAYTRWYLSVHLHLGFH